MTVPAANEAAPFYHTYIAKVGSGDIRELLEAQLDEALGVLHGITEDRSTHRYAAGKWSIREVLGHVMDVERLFVYRSMWIARGLVGELPSFDQDAAVASSAAHERRWAGMVAEFRSLRESTSAFFRSLPAEAWDRRGMASGTEVSVRALAYITVGHVTHHLRILGDRYSIGT